MPHLLVFLLETSDLFAGKLVGRVIKLQGALVHLLREGFEAIHLAFHLLQVQAGPRARGDTDGQEKVGTHHLILFSLALALFPGLLIRAGTGEEVLEGIALSQHGVAAHVVHPPGQAFATFGDEVLLEPAGGLLLRQVGHGDDGELLGQPPVEPVKVLVAAVHLLPGVAGHQLVGDVALHALELGLLGGVLDGALERVGVLLPLGTPGSQHHAQLVPVLHEAGRLAQHEGLPAGLDEGGEAVEVAAHRGRALGATAAAAAGRVRVTGRVATAGAQGQLRPGGHAVAAGGPAARRLVVGVGAAQGARLVGHGGAVVPVVVPVVIAALAGLVGAAVGRRREGEAGGGGGGGQREGLGRRRRRGLLRRRLEGGGGRQRLEAAGGEVGVAGGRRRLGGGGADDLHVGGREEAAVAAAVDALQPALDVLLAAEAQHLVLPQRDLPRVLRPEVVQRPGPQRHGPAAPSPPAPPRGELGGGFPAAAVPPPLTAPRLPSASASRRRGGCGPGGRLPLLRCAALGWAAARPAPSPGFTPAGEAGHGGRAGGRPTSPVSLIQSREAGRRSRAQSGRPHRWARPAPSLPFPSLQFPSLPFLSLPAPWRPTARVVSPHISLWHLDRRCLVPWMPSVSSLWIPGCTFFPRFEPFGGQLERSSPEEPCRFGARFFAKRPTRERSSCSLLWWSSKCTLLLKGLCGK